MGTKTKRGLFHGTNTPIVDSKIERRKRSSYNSAVYNSAKYVLYKYLDRAKQGGIIAGLGLG